MSKYTTEVRYICENYAQLNASVGYNSVQSVLDNSWDKVFDFDFPIFDENYREPLCKKILKHFYTREICEETVSALGPFVPARTVVLKNGKYALVHTQFFEVLLTFFVRRIVNYYELNLLIGLTTDTSNREIKEILTLIMDAHYDGNEIILSHFSLNEEVPGLLFCITTDKRRALYQNTDIEMG